MSLVFNAAARKLGIVSALTTASLEFLYGVVMITGLLASATPNQPIPDPFFTLMEVLILLMMPAIVVMMLAVHAWAPTERRIYSLAAVVFIALLAGLTCTVHFVILVLSRHAEFADLPRFLAFEWPSVVYVLDILAWDGFFSLSVLFAAPVFGGSTLALWIRYLLFASGVLALLGFAGVALGNMHVRNIGIVGYAGIFPVAALLIARLFHFSKDPPGQRAVKASQQRHRTADTQA